MSPPAPGSVLCVVRSCQSWQPRGRTGAKPGSTKRKKSPAQDKPTKGGKKKPPSRKVEKPSSPPTAGKQPAGGSFKTRQVSRAQTAGECITQLAVQLQSEVAESHIFLVSGSR